LQIISNAVNKLVNLKPQSIVQWKPLLLQYSTTLWSTKISNIFADKLQAAPNSRYL